MRDVRVRYKQTVLGVAWTLLRPSLSVAIFTAFFARLGGLSTDGHRPELFYLSGLLPWQLFTTALGSASNSLVANQSLLTKVYFPRLVLPISAILPPLADFLIALTLLAFLFPMYGARASYTILALPLFTALTVMNALAFGLWLSALSIEFRDVRHAIPFLLQLWMFATPVIYPAALTRDGPLRALLALNPMSGVIEGFRWCMFGKPPPMPYVWTSFAVASVLLFTGLLYFRRTERHFADLV